MSVYSVSVALRTSITLGSYQGNIGGVVFQRRKKIFALIVEPT